MNYVQANQILDQVREGFAHTEDEVIYALYLTGDTELHEGLRSEGMDTTIPPADFHAWCRERASMVGRG